MRSLLLILLFSGFQNFAQSKKIADNIKNLDNSQFIIDHNVKAGFSMKSPAAMKLIKIGKPATEKLIAALNDPTKVIMVHLTLCHIYFKQATFAGPKIISIDGVEINKYFLGEEHGEGLIISEVSNRKYIQPGDLEKIKLYWTKKVK